MDAARVDWGWLLSCVVVVLLSGLDLLLGAEVSVVGTLTVGPMMAAALTSPGRTALVGLLASGAALALATQGEAGTSSEVVRVGSVLGASVLGVVVAVRRREQGRRLERMSTIADVAQRALLAPVPAATGAYAFSSAYVSATREAAIGGDLLDVTSTGDRIDLIVGDVRGKGLEAVRLSAVMLAAFRELASGGSDLPALAAALEARLAAHLGDEDFVTAVVATLDPDGRVDLANCGHPAPLLVRGTAVTALEPPLPTTPFGLAPEPAERSVRLRPGDRVLLFTDGLVEARRRGSQEFVALPSLLATVGSDSLDTALDVVLRRLRGSVGGELLDDLAMLLVEYRGSEVRAPVARATSVATTGRAPGTARA